MADTAPLQPTQHQACDCRWERNAAGQAEFRECSEHYVNRRFPTDEGQP